MIPIKYSLWFVFITNLLYCSEAIVIFYEHKNYEGESYVPREETGCHNFPPEWNDRVSSVRTQGACLEVYEHANCQGLSETLKYGTPHHHQLHVLGLNDAITSYSFCSNDESQADLVRVAVEEHNKYRRLHGVPDLQPSERRVAQGYADSFDTSTSQTDHSGGMYVGNMGWVAASSRTEAVRKAVRKWYSESSKYDFNNPGYNKETVHFAGVVWKENTVVGIGVGWNSIQNLYVVVTFYDHDGLSHSSSDKYRENVLPPLVT